MHDKLTERARKAAEEIRNFLIEKCGPTHSDFISGVSAIFERNMRAMTLVELGYLIDMREKWLPIMELPENPPEDLPMKEDAPCLKFGKNWKLNKEIEEYAVKSWNEGKKR